MNLWPALPQCRSPFSLKASNLQLPPFQRLQTKDEQEDQAIPVDQEILCMTQLKQNVTYQKAKSKDDITKIS